MYLRLQEQQINHERRILQKTLRDLARIDKTSVRETPAIPVIADIAPPSMSGGHNSQVITSILTSVPGPLRASDIATRAFTSGLIKSSKELPGVRNIIWTVLRRNEKRFVKVGRGLWDLRARQEPRRPAERSAVS